MAITAKDCHILTTYFENKYKEVYGAKPVVNRNAARWNWEGMLHSLKSDEIKSLVDYYFTTFNSTRHSLQWFFFNYEKLIEGRQEVIDDRKRREQMRRESQERSRRWREKFGDERTSGNQLGSQE